MSARLLVSLKMLRAGIRPSRVFISSSPFM
jgi:hypothetical protein